jgi:adenylate cyclase
VTEWTCAACGGDNPAATRFCGHCGAPAESSPRTAPGPEPEAAEADVTQALRSFVTGQVADRLVEAGGEIPEERRLITALFADVSGFTSLADRLDPEELLEVIDPVISGLSSIVGRYEGYVEKFAGDALLALFGAPVSHEDDAERALRVALEMHRELPRICAQLPHEAELTLHCGVNSGHGIARILGSEARMDYGVLGDSVILAQRLESAAPTGETYVSDLTRRMTADRFEFEPVGELTLKGKSEAVLAWRLIGERSVARPTTAKRPLVGRERELETIAAALHGARAGAGEVLMVSGEPGVGKSRLTEAARERAETEGFRWLQTRCISYGAGVAYWPYMELLRVVSGIQPQSTPEAGRAALADAVADGNVLPYFDRLLGLPGADDDNVVSGLEPEAFRRGLHEAFAAWLSCLAGERPLVLAVEDLHWADRSSLELTVELARLDATRPLALYLTTRAERDHDFDELAWEPSVLRLDPLDGDGIGRLIRHALEAPPPRDLVPWAIERTGGNPFFVEELVRSLLEREILVRTNGRFELRSGWEERDVPPTLEGLLAARIDLLPRAATEVLQTASVIGRVVRVPLLAAVHGDDSTVSSVLGTLVDRGFLDPQGSNGDATVAFHHALVQDVAYSRLLRRRRRDLHRRVAEVAEALFGTGGDVIDLLARHLYLGEAGDKAIEYLVRAGERAKRLYANDEAIVHLERAVELAPDRAELRLELADLYELVGRYDDALAAYRAVRDARPGEVQAWAGMASTLRKRGEYGDALDVSEEALSSQALRGADLSPVRLQQGWTMSVAGRFRDAIDALEAGLAAATTATSRVTGHMLLQLARAETVEGRLGSALSHAREAERIFVATEDVNGLATTMRLLGDLHRNRGELEEAADVLRKGFEFATRTGSIEEVGGCLINLGLVELERGDPAESIVCTRQAIEEFERIGHASGLALGYGNLAYALSRAGAYDEALGHAERALEVARSIGNALAVADIRETMAEILLGQERFAEAAAQAEAAATEFLEMGVTTMATKSLGVAAEAWSKAGDAARARDSEERARSIVSA